ncbi:MAG: cysteine hydrolase [Chloroflexi bacterium]|nr:cysteine hydrolase [Chloroflexota bacterium]
MPIPKLTKKEDYSSSMPFKLEATSTVLVLIDLQYATACRTAGLGRRMTEEGRGHIVKWRFDRIEHTTVPNVKRLLAFFREHRLKVVYLTIGSVMPNYSDAPPQKRARFEANNNRVGTREHEILDEIKPMPGEFVINKTTNSAFWSSGFDYLLRSIEAKYLLFTGVSTNMCVEATARDAADIGYSCVMVEDAMATTHEELHRATLLNFQRSYGRAASTDEVLQELS